jgi:hypothetical protein
MKLAIFPLILSFATFAQTRELPQIPVPADLSSGAYAEGTVTRLSAEEVAGFIPWAQNARNQLNRAVTQARSLPLRERPAHIERAVRAVVDRSDGRQYQMFLRFALNRGMLLVDELERNVNMNEIGSQENALDLLTNAITVGLEFYESDLAFQQRAQSGDSAVALSYAGFGAAFMRAMYPSVVNVLDAGAQYRLLYKLIEMVNWDLSRDAGAAQFAETIVEAYEMTVDLPEQASTDDRTNLRLIRRLNGLRIVAPQPDVGAPVAATSAPSISNASPAGVGLFDSFDPNRDGVYGCYPVNNQGQRLSTHPVEISSCRTAFDSFDPNRDGVYGCYPVNNRGQRLSTHPVEISSCQTAFASFDPNRDGVYGCYPVNNRGQRLSTQPVEISNCR